MIPFENESKVSGLSYLLPESRFSSAKSRTQALATAMIILSEDSREDLKGRMISIASELLWKIR